MKRDLLSVADLSAEELSSIVKEAARKKKEGWGRPLEGKTLALIFEKPSLRTRVSFDVAMYELGGHAIYLSREEVGLGAREPIPDMAQVLGRYVSAIAARVFKHTTLEELARYSPVPVINALSDLEHPCQAVGDMLTIYEKKGRLSDLTVAFVGDGNNVANSLLLACALLGINFKFASPPRYSIKEEILNKASKAASLSGAEIKVLRDPEEAARGADVIYTDVWVSMGQEAEAEERKKAFRGYQVTEELLKSAKSDVILMHPMPIHHGEELAPNLLFSRYSVIIDQAENRLHAQKEILIRLLGG